MSRMTNYNTIDILLVSNFNQSLGNIFTLYAYAFSAKVLGEAQVLFEAGMGFRRSVSPGRCLYKDSQPF